MNVKKIMQISADVDADVCPSLLTITINVNLTFRDPNRGPGGTSSSSVLICSLVFYAEMRRLYPKRE